MRRLHAMLLAACWAGLGLASCKARDPEPARGSPTPATVKATASATNDTPAILAMLPGENPAQKGSTPPGSGLQLTSPAPEVEFVFSERGGGVAYSEQKDAAFHVVHNGQPGKAYAAVGPVVLSPDGRRWAHGALVGEAWRMVVDGLEGESFAAVQAPVFSPDGAHVAYQALAGEKWYLVVDSARSAGTSTRFLGHEFASDSSRIAYIVDVDDEQWGKLVVSDLAFKSPKVIEARASNLLVNEDRSGIAAIGLNEQQQRVLAFAFDRPDLVRRGPKYDAVFLLAHGPDGVSVAHTAVRAGKHFMVLDGAEAPLPPGELIGFPVVRPDRKAVGVFMWSGDSVVLRQFFRDAFSAAVLGSEAEGLAYAPDGSSCAYAAHRGESWFLVAGGKPGPKFDRVVSPKYSPDGRFVVYRARQNGKRFVVVADNVARTVRQHPAYEQVFPVGFTPDGRSIAYGVKDGPRLMWKVEAL